MDFNSITYSKKDGVATITKDNPESQYGMSRDGVRPKQVGSQ